MSGPVRDIVILGGGVAGWLTALTLARGLEGGAQRLILVEVEGSDAGLGPIGPALTLFPGTVGFLAGLGIDEARLIGRAGASYALGTVFSDAEDWFLPYGTTGAPMGSVAFHQLAARLRSEGQAVRLADYSLAAISAQAGRFAQPSGDPRSILSTLEVGMHVYAAALAELLVAEAGTAVRQTAAPFRRAIADPEGGVAAIELADGSRIAADLFLDCSGPAGLIIANAWESWANWLPCDRVLTIRAEAEGVPPPYAHFAAHPAGWQGTIPLQGGQGRMLLWSSAHVDDPEAVNVEGASVAFTTGRRAQLWRRNVIALGGAAALLDPLHPVALQSLANSLQRLLTLFPHDVQGGVEAAEYQRLTRVELESTRDYLMLHYKLNRRTGEPLWDAARAMPVPDSLQYKIDLFTSRGMLAPGDEELFEAPAWIALLDGLGLRARRHDALADAIPRGAIDRHFTLLREAMIAAVRAMPGHGAALGRVPETVR